MDEVCGPSERTKLNALEGMVYVHPFRWGLLCWQFRWSVKCGYSSEVLPWWTLRDVTRVRYRRLYLPGFGLAIITPYREDE